MDDLYQSFLDWYGTYGYLALFVGVLLENAGLPVPGETAVLIAGFLSCPPAGLSNRSSTAFVVVPVT